MPRPKRNRFLPATTGVIVLGGNLMARQVRESAFPVTLYLIFAAADLCFSLLAFSCGVAEINPLMAWFLRLGLFIPGKVVLSLFVAALMAGSSGASRQGRCVVWGGVAAMGLVVVYHLWGIPSITGLDHPIALAVAR